MVFQDNLFAVLAHSRTVVNRSSSSTEPAAELGSSTFPDGGQQEPAST